MIQGNDSPPGPDLILGEWIGVWRAHTHARLASRPGPAKVAITNKTQAALLMPRPSIRTAAVPTSARGIQRAGWPYEDNLPFTRIGNASARPANSPRAAREGIAVNRSPIIIAAKPITGTTM